MKNLAQIRIVPKANYGDFVGVVIACSSYNHRHIQFLKLAKVNENSVVVDSKSILLPGVIGEHNISKEEKTQFLISEVQKFATENEEIAMWDCLAQHLGLK